MGGGGLRILGHKRWHVWRRDNIERVERDEQQRDARERQLAVERRRAEQERRVEALVTRSGGDPAAPGHVNLFQKEEAAASRPATSGGEGRRPRGGGEALGDRVRLPWYAREQTAERQGETRSSERKRKRELSFADPLQQMRPAPSSDAEDERSQRRLSGSDRRRYSAQYSSSDKRRHEHEAGGDHRREKSKKHKHKKHRASMEELRRERDEREATERKRAEILMRSRS